MPTGSTPRIGAGDRDGALTGLLQNLSLEGLKPPWYRPVPPRLPVMDGEVALLFMFNGFVLYKCL